MTFKELNLSAPLLRAVQEAGYETPSPIQAAAIPPVLSGRDLMGCAQTGTGKTAAFALPMLDRLTANAPRRKGAIRALILTPTRELALQIGESFDAYGKYLKLRSTVIFGGVGQAPQVEALKKGVDILIACPGRLNDLIGQGFIDLSDLEIFVLDEADRMLDMGFVHDVKKVIAKLPGERQNLMFSATMPTEIEQLAAGILRKPAFEGGPGVQYRGPHPAEPVSCGKGQQEIPAALAHQEPAAPGGECAGVQPHQARRG